MSVLEPGSPLRTELRRVVRHELEAIRARWVWFVALGIVMVVLGTIALLTPWVATGAAVLTFGVLLMAAGIATAVGAFWSRDWSGFLVSLLMGVLYVVLGLIFVRKPGLAATALTALIASLLMVGGVVKIVAAVTLRFPQWIWVVVSGGISLALGLMIWNDFPESSLWVIGLFLGIDMIFHGWFDIMLGLSLRRLPKLGTMDDPTMAAVG
jgi:uncharacterized membrane protein HdeD (DUF308 family)